MGMHGHLAFGKTEILESTANPVIWACGRMWPPSPQLEQIFQISFPSCMKPDL